MCGRFTLTTTSDQLALLFDLDKSAVPDLSPRFNIAPTQAVLAVRVASNAGARRAGPSGSGSESESGSRSESVATDGSGPSEDSSIGSKPAPDQNLGETVAPASSPSTELAWLRWGLVPFWAKDLSISSRLINARSETVDQKPSFRAAFKRRRCLIPISGFYEWRKFDDGKQPHLIRMKDGAPFALAGLWEHWTSPDGSEVESCTLLTTEANDFMQPLHHRMPVILDPEDFDLWLDPEIQHAELLRPLFTPYADDRMDDYPVSTHVNSPRNDDVECIARVERLD